MCEKNAKVPSAKPATTWLLEYLRDETTQSGSFSTLCKNKHIYVLKASADWTHVREWMPSDRHADSRQHRLLPEAGWIRILGEKKQKTGLYKKERKKNVMMHSGVLHFQLTLPSFLSSNPHSASRFIWQNKPEHRERWLLVTPVKHRTTNEEQKHQERKRTPLNGDRPIGGTAQTHRAGAVGGRLNWSSTVLGRAGSITVMSLQEAGPERTHNEHWRRRADSLETWNDLVFFFWGVDGSL